MRVRFVYYAAAAAAAAATTLLLFVVLHIHKNKQNVCRVFSSKSLILYIGLILYGL